MHDLLFVRYGTRGSEIYRQQGRHAPKRLGPGTSPVWSPDKKQVACITTYLLRNTQQLALMGKEGGALRLLTTHEGEALFPAWHPNGKTLAFFQREPQAGIYTIDTNGKNESLLFATPTCAGLAWRSDGLGVWAIISTEMLDITVRPGRTGEATQIIGPANAGRESFRSLSINAHTTLGVFERDGVVCTFDPRTKRITRLHEGWSPRLARNGHTLYYSYKRTVLAGEWSIWQMETNGKNVVRLLSDAEQPCD